MAKTARSFTFPPPSPSSQLTDGDHECDGKIDYGLVRNWAKLTVESMPDRLERYVDCFTVPIPHLRIMMDAFEHELRLGLDMFASNKQMSVSSKCSFKMLDSCVTHLPTGSETGVYYALDFGGTNFRVVRANLLGRNTLHKTQYKMSLSTAPNAKHLTRGLMDARATATKMFDFFATSCRELMEQEGDMPSSRDASSSEARETTPDGESLVKAGFTFSFPCSQRCIDSAVLIEWTKGFETGRNTNDPVEGLDVVQLADAAFRRFDVPLRVSSILNDTVGTLLSCCYEMQKRDQPPCLIGMILGTGVNACYFEKEAGMYGYKGNVINIECGNFNRELPLSNVDDEVDFAEVSNRGRQRLEKMIAGAYLGEICRRAIVKVLQHLAPEAAWKPFSFSSENASNVIEDTSTDYSTTKTVMEQVWNASFNQQELYAIHRLCTTIVERAAALSAVIICGTAKKTQYLQPAMGGVSVAVDGERTGKLIHLLSADDGSGKGAAILAAVLDSPANRRPCRLFAHLVTPDVVDKHQPRTLNELTCHSELTNLLKKITANGNIPHILFYGGSGAGKKTRIMAVLRALFGDAVDRVKAETITPEGVNAEFVCSSSLYHNQISATELGTKDRICVQYMIKQLAAQAPATCYAVQNTGSPKYRVFVLQEAEKLSTEAQAGLRRTFEKYVRNARAILHCQQLSSIIQPLRSRCLCIRVPLPTSTEVFNVLQNICQKEGVTSIPDEYLRDIVVKSERNLRRAIFMLETAAMQKSPPIESLSLPWQLQCEEIVDKVLKGQGISSLLTARELLYELLTSLIPAELILQTLCKIFVLSTDYIPLKFEIIRAASHYSYTLKIGSKDIWHLEAFVAQCINFHKRSLNHGTVI